MVSKKKNNKWIFKKRKVRKVVILRRNESLNKSLKQSLAYKFYIPINDDK